MPPGMMVAQGSTPADNIGAADGSEPGGEAAVSVLVPSIIAKVKI